MPPDSMARLWSRLWGAPDSALVPDLSHSWTAGGGGWSVRREGRWIVGLCIVINALNNFDGFLSVNVSLNSHGLHPCLSQYWPLARTLLILNITPTTTIASTGTQTEQMTFHSLALFLPITFSCLFGVKLYDWWKQFDYLYSNLRIEKNSIFISLSRINTYPNQKRMKRNFWRCGNRIILPQMSLKGGTGIKVHWVVSLERNFISQKRKYLILCLPHIKVFMTFI